MNIRTVSKTKLVDFNKCPLMAYKKVRDNSAFIENADIQRGNLAHELAEKKIADEFNLDFSSENIEERFNLEVINEVLNIMENTNILHYYKGMQVFGIEESVVIELDNIKEDDIVSLSCRFDIVSYAEIDNQRYIVVDDLKSGQAVKESTDTEAIIYAFVAYEKFGGLPVIFRRIALSSNKKFVEIFTPEKLEKLRPSIMFQIKKYVEEMESDMIPEYTPGDHCLCCPFISSCQGRKKVDSLQNKLKASIWAKAYAKKYENEVKSAAKEIMEKIPTAPSGEEVVLVPFLNGKYGVKQKTSSSWGLKGRKISKKDIINLLIETGDIESYKDALDIKFNESLAKKLTEDYEIETKETVKTTLSFEDLNEGD